MLIEHKHFEMFGQAIYDCPKTVVSEEYSTEYKPDMELKVKYQMTFGVANTYANLAKNTFSEKKLYMSEKSSTFATEFIKRGVR